MISAFNTGRQYTAKGQRIAWVQLSTNNVAMVDIDRGIDYILIIDETPTNQSVLAAYDANDTARWNEVEYAEFRTVEKALEAAAAKL
jgi:hypothetical protein